MQDPNRRTNDILLFNLKNVYKHYEANQKMKIFKMAVIYTHNILIIYTIGVFK